MGFPAQAYDLFTSRVADDAMVDIQLVGDSLANVVMGGRQQRFAIAT